MSGGFLDPETLRRRRVSVALLAGVLLLALIESTQALVAPLRAPSDQDWQAAAAAVRAGFRPGDLVVAAPGWADPVMRLHLGDLVPIRVAGRIDGGRFSRIWEISQRGARAEDSRGLAVAHQSGHGALTLRRYERSPVVVVFDFTEQWEHARVFRSEPGRGEIPCERKLDRHQCPHIGFNFVKPQLLEVGTTLRQALYAQPVDGAAVVIEYPEAPLGRTLVVGAGLHHVWHRKAAAGKVRLRVLVNGKEVASEEASNRTGWRVRIIDTAGFAGKSATVRFEIRADKAFARHFGFAAEARS